jgi:hypothetical protein
MFENSGEFAETIEFQIADDTAESPLSVVIGNLKLEYLGE